MFDMFNKRLTQAFSIRLLNVAASSLKVKGKIAFIFLLLLFYTVFSFNLLFNFIPVKGLDTFDSNRGIN